MGSTAQDRHAAQYTFAAPFPPASAACLAYVRALGVPMYNFRVEVEPAEAEPASAGVTGSGTSEGPARAARLAAGGEAGAQQGTKAGARLLAEAQSAPQSGGTEGTAGGSLQLQYLGEDPLLSVGGLPRVSEAGRVWRLRQQQLYHQQRAAAAAAVAAAGGEEAGGPALLPPWLLGQQGHAAGPIDNELWSGSELERCVAGYMAQHPQQPSAFPVCMLCQWAFARLYPSPSAAVLVCPWFLGAADEQLQAFLLMGY